MALVGEGDTDAFEQLVERHQALVAGTVARMLGNNADVEDIAQQVFIRVWKNASRYVPRAKFTTWLLTITRNLVFNELRRTNAPRCARVSEQPGADRDAAARTSRGRRPRRRCWRANSNEPSNRLFKRCQKRNAWR